MVLKDVKFTNYVGLPCSGWFSMQVRLVAMFFLISVKLRCLGICFTFEKEKKIKYVITNLKTKLQSC